MWLDVLNQMKKLSGKTTEQISEESGIPKGTLNKIFAGQTKDPQYTTLRAIVHCLGFSIDDLDKKTSSESELPDSKDVEDVTIWLKHLIVAKGYKNTGEDFTEKEAEFLIHLVGLLDSFFSK